MIIMVTHSFDIVIRFRGLRTDGFQACHLPGFGIDNPMSGYLRQSCGAVGVVPPGAASRPADVNLVACDRRGCRGQFGC